MNEIVIPKRMIVAGLILIGLAVALTWGVPQIISRFKPQASVPTLSATALAGQEDAAARDAALAGAQAFYTVDYQKGQQAWLDKLCSVSTQTGCTVYQNVIIPHLWSQLEGARIATTAQVSAQEKVQDQVASTRGNAPTQIWQLQIQLSAPWPMQTTPQTTFTALALVIKENGVWKFERFLTEDETKIYAPKDNQP